MNWTNDKSLKLSRFCVYLFVIILTGLVFTLPLWLPRVYDFRLSTGRTLGQVRVWVMAMLAGTAVCAGFALWHLHGLLQAIARADVFCVQNVARLRALSWACLGAGLFFLTGCWYAPTLALLSAAAAFVGLILRVVKNVFAQAVALKKENDFTI